MNLKTFLLVCFGLLTGVILGWASFEKAKEIAYGPKSEFDKFLDQYVPPPRNSEIGRFVIQQHGTMARHIFLLDTLQGRTWTITTDKDGFPTRWEEMENDVVAAQHPLR